jgi:nicotinamidase-related amidase
MNELSIKALRSFSGVGPIDLWEPSTALLIVDMQVSCAYSEGYTIRRLKERGLDQAAEQYRQQVALIIPNIVRILERARNEGKVVVHTRVEKTSGALPGGQEHSGRNVEPGSRESEFIDELKPLPNELVVSKMCSGVFAGTNLDFLLRRININSLIVTGVVTNGCVEQAITHAHDLGYACALVSDATAALTDEIHENALLRLEHRRAHVIDTDTLLNQIRIEGTGVL